GRDAAVGGAGEDPAAGVEQVEARAAGGGRARREGRERRGDDALEAADRAALGVADRSGQEEQAVLDADAARRRRVGGWRWVGALEGGAQQDAAARIAQHR